ncbi:hypothetical protein B0T16DRAFT_499032 [Cercophora newfieldiana]|uniref:Uncharacterized protein n=1 Tax=Cercophora newfieldiana TaxID=92897 RepID=A0AA40CYN1_9PEZI|nr:hypothetical protein B0T16DRAFT_499032 [Cercophora newfieldiana]
MSTMIFRTQQPLRLFTSERALAHHDLLRSEQVDTHLRRGPNFNCPSPGPLAFPFPQPPPTPRPSPNHFAVVVLHARTVEAAMYWAELRDGNLVVDVVELLEFNQKMLTMAASRLKEGRCVSYTFGNGAQRPHSVVVDRRRRPNGVAAFHASNWNKGDIAVPSEWINRTVLSLGQPSTMQMWPGPMVFTAFQYNTPVPNGDDDWGRSSINIINMPNGDGNYTTGITNRPDDMSSVTDSGYYSRSSSICQSQVDAGKCQILDFTEADFNNTIFYLRHLETNVASPDPSSDPWNKIDNRAHATVVSPMLHSNMYKELNIPAPQTTHTAGKIGIGPDFSMRNLLIPLKELPAYPCAIAFAVGLPWYIVPLSISSPPFSWVRKTSNPLMSTPSVSILTRTIILQPDQLVDAEGFPVYPDHVFALIQYVRRNPPDKWYRGGDHGFEAYWIDNREGSKCCGPYTLRDQGKEHQRGKPVSLDPYHLEDIRNKLATLELDKRTEFFQESIIKERSDAMYKWRGGSATDEGRITEKDRRQLKTIMTQLPHQLYLARRNRRKENDPTIKRLLSRGV